MAVTIDIISKKFFTQYRNGNTFAANLTEFTEILQNGVIGFNKFEQTVRITIVVNDAKASSMTYTNLGGGISQLFAPGLNFKNQGLATTMVVQIFKGTLLSGEATVTAITGGGFNTIKVTNTNLGFLTTGHSGTDITIKVKSVPNYIRYQYGINPESFSALLYTSPLDGHTQAYTLGGVGAAYQSMTRVGAHKSWDLTSDLQVKFNSTISTYAHEFSIKHEFRTPWYIESEDLNLTGGPINPSDLFGVATRKYTNNWNFGFNSTAITYAFHDNFGTFGSGNVGYYNEALNGFANLYTVASVAIVNASLTGKIEVTEANVVTAVITASSPVFTATQRAIAHHSKRTKEADYSNKTETSDEVFVRGSLLCDAGTPVVGSGIITNMSVTQDSTTQITVVFTVSFTSGQQDILNLADKYLLALTVGDQSLSAANEKPVDLILALDNYTKNSDDTSLVTSFSLAITNLFHTFAAAIDSTDINGWDGDWYGVAYRFNLNQVSGAQPNVIEFMEFRVIASDGTTEFTVKSQSIPLGLPTLVSLAPYIYQVFNIDASAGFHLPPTHDLNIIDFSTFKPAVPAAFQTVNGRLSFRIPWRDWVENGLVPTTFYDATKPQNNLNQKTSNYSGVDGYDIYIELYAEIRNFNTGITTPYKFRSDLCVIKDFDDDPLGIFTAAPLFYDLDGFLTNDLFIDEEVQIDYIFTHSLGTLSPQDLWGFIWLEPKDSSAQPWYLSTFDDWTDPLNPLTPTDTLAAGNTTLVEVISSLNQVILRCKTNKSNLVDNTTYFVRVKLGKQT